MDKCHAHEIRDSWAELEAVIREKLRMSYLYNLEWVDEPTHQLSKFNIVLEFPRQNGHPERMVVALEYKPPSVCCGW